jgi:hypothetical protein
MTTHDARIADSDQHGCDDIRVIGQLQEFTLTIRMTRTEREVRQGIATDSRKALREHFADEYPTARIRVAGPERVDATTATYLVQVVL